jgi:RNA polymerase sigma-70 factor (ECF subfamily)
VDASDTLLRRCQGGDQAALAELVRLYQDRILRLAVRVLGDGSAAEEAAAASLVKLWNKCRQWRGESSAATWIYRLALRTILDVRRGRRLWLLRWGTPLEESPAAVPGPQELLIARDEREHKKQLIAAALGELSLEDRALVHLYYYEGRSLGEIAVILDTGRDALKMRLMRARERLRKRLSDVRELQ